MFHMMQEEFKDCNHWLYMEEPEQFNKLLLHFVAKS